MVIKTFNLDEQVYKQFSEYCKKEGISMSKRVENFIREEIKKLGVKNEVSEKVKMPSLKAMPVEEHSFRKYC